MLGDALVFGGERRKESPFVVVGFPFDSTSSYRHGSAFGPNAIREASKYVEFLANYVHFDMDNVLYDDIGDVAVVPGDVLESLKRLETILDSIDRVPVVLGGEHTLTYAAKALKPSCLLVFDAHLDMREDYLGNPWSHACWLRRLLEVYEVKTMVYGARGYVDEEIEFAKERGVMVARGPGEVSRWVRGCSDVYVSVDVDVFDPSIAPGVGNPEPGGITFEEYLKAISEALFKVPLKGMDVVEVSPQHDPSGITSVLAVKVIVETTAMQYVVWNKNK